MTSAVGALRTAHLLWVLHVPAQHVLLVPLEAAQQQRRATWSHPQQAAHVAHGGFLGVGAALRQGARPGSQAPWLCARCGHKTRTWASRHVAPVAAVAAPPLRWCPSSPESAPSETGDDGVAAP